MEKYKMISRNQDMYNIKFLENQLTEKKAEVKQSQPETPTVDTVKKQTRKIDNNESVRSRFNNVILSAGSGDITDIGGPTKQMGFNTNNSIWDTDVLSRLIDQETNKEKTQKQKERIEIFRNSLKDGRIDEMVESIQSTDTSKSSSVTAMGEYNETRKYKASNRNIGMFDNEEFSDLPELTEGEKVSERAREQKEKDESWKDIKAATKLTNTLDNFFNILTEKKDG